MQEMSLQSIQFFTWEMHKFNAHIIKCSAYGVTVSSDGLQIPEIIY